MLFFGALGRKKKFKAIQPVRGPGTIVDPRSQARCGQLQDVDFPDDVAGSVRLPCQEDHLGLVPCISGFDAQKPFDVFVQRARSRA